MLREFLNQNFNKKELTRYPYRTLSRFFWESPQITVWTMKFLISRLSYAGNNPHTFSAIKRQLDHISTNNIVFSLKVFPADRLPEYGEYVVVFHTQDGSPDVVTRDIAKLVSTREFVDRIGYKIPITKVVYWME